MKMRAHFRILLLNLCKEVTFIAKAQHNAAIGR